MLVIFSLLVLLQTEGFQTFAAQRIAAWIGSETKCVVEIDRIGITLDGSIFLNNLFISDQQNDTLLFAKKIYAQGVHPFEENGPIKVELAQVESFVFNLNYSNEGVSNMDFLIDYFASNEESKDTSQLGFHLGRLDLADGRFRYSDKAVSPSKDYGIDWSYLDVKAIDLTVSNLDIIGEKIDAEHLNLALQEKSGFELKNLTCNPNFDERQLELSDIQITTNQSLFKGDLRFTYQSMDDFSDFSNKVLMDHIIDDASVNLGDLAYFSPLLKGNTRNVNLKSRVIGTLNELQLQKTELETGRSTRFLADFVFRNLENPDSTSYRVYFNRFSTDINDLSQIELPPFDSSFQQRLSLPDIMGSLGKIELRGEIMGSYSQINLFGMVKTDIGEIKTDFQLDASKEITSYSGSVSAQNADLGKIYKTDQLGKISCEASLSGQGDNLDNLSLDIDTKISQFELLHYNLQNIEAKGNYEHRNFNGNLSINDSNLNLVFDGIVNFREALPILDFDAQIASFNPGVFGLIADTSLSSFSGDIQMRSIGLDYSVFEGYALMQNLKFCSRDKEYQIENIKIESSRGVRPLIRLSGALAEAEISGDFVIEDVPASLLDITSHIIPSIQPSKREHKNQELDLRMTLRDIEPVTSVFLPELKIAAGSYLKANVNESASQFECTFDSDYILFQGYKAQDILIDIHRPVDFVYGTITAESISIPGGVKIDAIGLEMRIDKDTINTSFTWNQMDRKHAGDINGKLILSQDGGLRFEFAKSDLTCLGENFTLTENANISWLNSRLEIDDFRLKNKSQWILVDGIASENSMDSLNISIGQFNLITLQKLLPESDTLYGVLDARATIHQVFSKPYFSSSMKCIGLTLNRTSVGDISFDAKWDERLESLDINGNVSSVLNNDTKTEFVPLSFTGYCRPYNTDNQLDLTVNLKALKLKNLNSFLPKESIALDGTARGSLYIKGKLEAPQLESRIFLERSSVYVHYLNTKYYFSDYLNIKPDEIALENFAITDEEGHQGALNGKVSHKNFSKWKVDVRLAFMEPFLMLNTSSQSEEAFFGKAYGTGYLGVSGDINSLSYQAQVKTEKGTYLGLPMGSSTEDEYDSFITFKTKSDSIATETKRDLSGLKMNFGIDVTPEARFEIIFDKSVGDVISGAGRGHIDLGVDQFSNLSMTGGLDLTEGNYKFTLKNLINKDFTVTPGGRIDWSGDPLAGNLDITAVYKVPASLYDLLNDPQYQGGQRVNVNLGLSLKGPMLNPVIDFDIDLPTVDQMTRSRVSAVLSSDQERNRQAFALLMLRRFVSPPSVTADHSSTSALSANGTELLSSQISNWLGQISNDFNLGFNYNPGDDISNEEIALALSTQFFNDRLILSSNLGVSRNNSNANTQNTSNLIGDVRIEYKLTPAGKIRLVMYNESNDYRVASTQQSPYTQGLGVIYREDFDNLQQLIEGIRKMLKGRPREEEKS